MEMTLVLIKPDAFEKRLTGETIRRFEALGLKLCGCKMFRFSPELVKTHYSHLAERPFFPELRDFMLSTPVIALALAGDNVIERVRAAIGPTNSKQAPKGTIRGDLGEDAMRNIVHASDSADSAAAELKRFFKPEEIFA